MKTFLTILFSLLVAASTFAATEAVVLDLTTHKVKNPIVNFGTGNTVDFTGATVNGLPGAGTVTQFNFTDTTGIDGTVTNATSTPTLSLTITESGVTNLVTDLAAKQPLDADLTALAALSGTDTIYYRSGTSTWSPVTIGGNMTFIGGTLDSTGGGDVTSVFGRTGDVVAASNDYTFSQIGSKPTTLSGYGITDAQPIDSDLTAIAALTTTSFGRSFLDRADAAAGRTLLGLGTLATQSGTFSGTSSGTNTGDQTSIVGITGTKAQFDTAVTDGNFLYVGDVTQYTDENAQDAVGAMIDSSLNYVDATPLLQRAALTGDITASAGSNATTLATVNSNVGSFTNANITVNGKGLITAASNGSAGGGGDALTTDPLSQFASTTSAQLRGVLSDESGTGVFLTDNGSAANLTSFPTFNQNTTGSAATLTTSRTLWGQSFDGSANVTGSLTSVGNITGGASNMTITAGTGNSRTLSFQSTTAGGVATTFLTGNANQTITMASGFTAAGNSTIGNNAMTVGTLDILDPVSGSKTLGYSTGTGRILAGGVAMPVLSDTLSVFATSTSNVIGVGTIELGHASDTTLSRASAGVLAVEGVNVLLNGGALGTPSSGTLTNATGLPVAGITSSTSTALGVGSLELGHATDTTLSRSSAGVLAVEGVKVLATNSTSGTQQGLVAVNSSSAAVVGTIARASGTSTSGTPGTNVATITAGGGNQFVCINGSGGTTNGANTQITTTITYSDSTTTSDTSTAASSGDVQVNDSSITRAQNGARANLTAHSAKKITAIAFTTAGTGTGTRAGSISAVEIPQ